MRQILQDCLDGKPLERSEASLLAAADGEVFSHILATAAELRDRHKGRVVTYSPKIFVPLTNLCRDFCGYCTFRKAPQEGGAKTLTIDEVLGIVNRGKQLGCTEVLFSLGDKPEALYPEMKEFLRGLGFKRTIDYLWEACRVVLVETGMLPHSNPGIMGRSDLRKLREVNVSLGLMLESTSPRLSSPWGPHANAPDKKPELRLRTLRQAGELRIPFTTGILIGIGESWRDRIESLFTIRDRHQRYGHVQEVIIQNFRSKAGIPMFDHPEPSHGEMLKTIALARLIFGGEMNLQAPPNLNQDNYQDYIGAGINDWGGVSPLTPDFINPEAPWPELAVLSRKTAEAGYVLKPRLPLYPEFILNRDDFVSPSLLPYLEKRCGGDGLVRNDGCHAVFASVI